MQEEHALLPTRTLHHSNVNVIAVGLATSVKLRSIMGPQLRLVRKVAIAVERMELVSETLVSVQKAGLETNAKLHQVGIIKLSIEVKLMGSLGASTTSKNPTGADNIDALQEGDDSNSYTLFFVIGAVGAVAVAALAAIGIKSRRELHEDEEGVVDKDMFESPNVNGGPTLSSAFNEDLESRGTLTSIGTGGGGNLTPKDSITIF